MAQSASVKPLEAFVKEHLLYIQTKAEAGEYADAMAAVQETKVSSTNNIYIRALEQQLGHLLDLSSRNELTEEHKLEILEPMSCIIDQALGSLPLSSKEPTPSENKQYPAAALTAEEKAEALEQLKVRYFEQAGRHLSAGEYELALGEIRRVYVIDPDNVTAQQYESVIQELLKLKVPSANAAAAPASPKEVMHEYERALEHRSPLDVRLNQAPPLASPVRLVEPEATLPESIPDQYEDLVPPHSEPVESVDEPVPPISYTPVSDEPPPELADLSQPPAHSDELVVFSHERQTAPNRPRISSRTLRIAVLAIGLVTVGTVILLSSRSTDQPSTASSTNAMAKAADQQQPAQTNTEPSPTSSIAHVSVKPPAFSPTDQTKGNTHEGNSSRASEPASVPESNALRSDQSSESSAQVRSASSVPVVTEDVVPATVHQESQPMLAQNAARAQETQNLTVAEPDPEPFIAVEKEPQLAKLETPQIPEIAWQTGAEARVVVRVMIDPDGKPVQTRVLKSNNTIVENAVVAAIMKSTFTPGIMGKSPVTAWVTIPLTFKRRN
jgi:TonB family protein